MKKYLLKSFALLAMLFSALTLSAQSGVDWSVATSVIGTEQYKVAIVSGADKLDFVNNIQQPGWAAEQGIHIVFTKGITECSLVNGTGCATEGGGMIMYLSALTARETKVIVKFGTEETILWVYNADGTTDETPGSGEGGDDPEPTPEPETPSVVYCDFPTGHEGNANFADANGRILVSLVKKSETEVRLVVKSADAAIKNLDLLYVEAAGANPKATTVGSDVVESDLREMSVDITYPTAPAKYTFMIQWSNPAWEGRWQTNLNDITIEQLCTESGGEGGETPSTPTEIYDVNFALASNGSSAEATTGDAAQAIDNNPGSRWESASADPQTWTLDLGQARIFNTLEIVWEGAYGKTFTVSVSDDKETWTPVWTVEGQELAGFPYTQTQKIDKTTARYIQFHGTARGTGYGYSFWEFRVFLLGETTLTTLEATPATQYMHMGEENVITVTAKDQIGKVMENAGEVAYTISPVEAGVINDNVFTPSQNGTATIVAAIGDVKSAPFDIITYVSQLASLEAKPANGLAKVGDGLAINVTAKDQNGQFMADAGEVTYTITPVDAGTITNNIYTPARIGSATIVAAIGEVKAAAFDVFAYDGENVALSPDINNSKIIAQSDFTPSGTDAWHAIDGNEGSVWQGSATNGTAGDEAARTYDSWFVVDFGAEYDVNLVSINFEGACSQEYTVAFSADNATWSLAYNYVGNAGVNGHTKLIYGTDLQNATKVRYARFYSIKAATEWGMKIFEFKVFGTESASPTKAVSASVNDAAMGTATVTQDGVAVTEVTTGSEVTFTAIANEGYVFVNWSNGNTNPSFTTTVNAAMHLTANFRALGTVYCNTPMTVDGHTIYVTMKRTAPESYELIVRSEENLENFGGTVFYMPTDALVVDLRNKGVLSDDKHTLTGTFTAEKVPYMTTPLYVVFEGIGEKTYQQLTNIEYDVECSEDVTVTGLALNPATVSIMVGGTQKLKPVFTPAHAFTNELQWTSSSESIATVDANGLVTAVAEGEAVIAATLLSNPAITATCNVTVTAFTAHTFYGNGADGGVDFAYNLTYNANGTVTIVADILTNNPGLGVTSFSIDEEWKDMTKNANGTYTRTSEKTFSVGQEVHCFLYAPYTNGVGRLDFDYIVGSSNERPNVAVTSVVLDQTYCNLLINETTQLTATINPGFADNKNVTWSSSAENVATVDANGLVTAKSAGTAIITATSDADNTKTATCTVNVVAALTDAIYHANDFFTINGQLVGFNYTITRTPERKLRYEVAVNGKAVVDGTPVEFNIRLNDGFWNDMTKDGTGHYTFESSRTYQDNDSYVGFFYAVYAGGDSRIDIDNYTVGSTNSPVPTMVAINESDEAANAALTGSIDAVIGRAFTNTYWQTISLPFALNQGQLKEVFGDGVQVAKLNSSIVASTDNATFELNFVYVSEIEAATPYLIHPSKEVAKGQVVRDVPVNLFLNDVVTEDATMIPVLFKSTFPAAETNYWLAENGYLYGGATDIEGMRAYFTFPNLTAEQASRMRARVVFNENTETSVDNITIDESAVKVIQNGQLIIIRNGEKYNVQGQKL